FEKPLRPDDPFGPLHIPVDEGRKRTRLSAEQLLDARPPQRVREKRAVRPAERLPEQANSVALPLQVHAGHRVARQTQLRTPRRDVRSGPVDQLAPFDVTVPARRSLGKPFHVENPVAKPEDRRDEAREPAPGEERMIPEPPPPRALRENVTR